MNGKDKKSKKKSLKSPKRSPKTLHPEVSKYFSELSKKRKKKPASYWRELQKKSVLARRKKFSTD